MSRPRRLVSISHSYSVALNRSLADAMAVEGRGSWEITAVAPRFFHGDMRPVPLERGKAEQCAVIPISARLTRFPHLFTYSGQVRDVLRSGWDLVHCWEEPFVAAGGQVALATPRDTPLVFWTAQNLSKRYPPPFSWIERYVIGRAAGWLACGQTVAETLLPRGYNRRPHEIAPLGVDVGLFRPDADQRAHTLTELGWSTSGPPVVGYMGRFVEEKGIRLLLDALDATQSSWRAILVGAGPLEPLVRRFAERHGDRVRLVTGVVHDDVPRYLTTMDCLVAPSLTTRSWREQFGRMLIEAFACGVPVITSDSGEIPYVVGDAGVVVPENDTDAITEAIGAMLADPQQRLDYSRRGLERVHREYAWPVIARRTLAFFDRLLDEPGNSAA